MDNPETFATLGTQDTERRQTKHKNRKQKTKKMSKTDLTKNRGGTQALAKGKQFLHLTRHIPCNPYSQDKKSNIHSNFNSLVLICHDHTHTQIQCICLFLKFSINN